MKIYFIGKESLSMQKVLDYDKGKSNSTDKDIGTLWITENSVGNDWSLFYVSVESFIISRAIPI